MTYFAYPFHIDGDGRVARVDHETYIRQLIEQVIFTLPGERVNRLDFGSPVNQLVFAPNNSEHWTTVQQFVQAALQHWLGTMIMVEAVQVSGEENILTVLVQYTVLLTRERQVALISQNLVS
jgi:Bacteriophage baseplate protein W